MVSSKRGRVECSEVSFVDSNLIQTFNLGYPKKNWPEASPSHVFPINRHPPFANGLHRSAVQNSFDLLNHQHIKRGFKRVKKDSFTDRKEREEIKEANASAIERNTEG